MVNTKTKIQKTKNSLFLIIFLSAHLLNSTYSFSWNFEKGGNDWPDTCNEGNQAPIDISAPFTYKSKIKNFSYLKNKKRIRSGISLSEYDDRISFLQ